MANTSRRVAVIVNHLKPVNESSVEKQDCLYADFDYTSAALNASTLTKERSKATFDVNELNVYLEGGIHKAQMKNRFMRELERDPIFKTDDYYDNSRDQARERTMEKIVRALKYYAQEAGDREAIDMRSQLISLIDPSVDTRVGVHYGLFKGAIESNGTEEQVAKYQYDVQTMKITGCFSMTELGHGSYIQGLETTATYDKERQEFVINTPTLTATKWWIGGAAETATHTVCFARLLIGEQDYGVHIFLVQLRDPETFTLLPGINIGDCGKKLGRQGIDNGWIQFANVRIPRENMLMKYAKVAADGTYTKPPLAQLAYGALVMGRVALARRSALTMQQIVTIATRYGAVRRQFVAEKNALEQPILDYATHQYRLMPLLAAAYALHVTSLTLDKLYAPLKNKKELKKEDLNALKDLHSTSAGIKSFSTWAVQQGSEEARQTLGGHGYSSYSAIGDIANDFLVNCSWEGDNTVLSQQTARYLLKALQSVMMSKPLGPSVGYLSELPNLVGAKAKINGDADLLDPKFQREALAYLCVKLLTDVAPALQSKIANGVPERVAWNESTVELVQCARAHTYHFMINAFIDYVRDAPKEDMRAALKQLCDLFALNFLAQNLTPLLEGGYLTADQSKLIRRKVLELCSTVRTQAIPLTDAFNLSDFVLRSPLGRHDGNVYHAYFNQVVSAPNCQRNKAPYWERLIKPLNNATAKIDLPVENNEESK
jgi:acyl-CoA oxidase